MSYCLDTNIVIDILRNNKDIVKKLEKIKDFRLYITAITLCELYKGAMISREKEQNMNIINSFIESVEILNFDLESCKSLGDDYLVIKNKGMITEDLDLMIASIVKSNKITLITKNKKHFENIPNLKLEIWS